jgi:hypothetical protein
MEQLGEAIDSSLSDSEQIAEVITRIKSGGYDVFLARGDVGFHEHDEAAGPNLVGQQSSSHAFQVTPEDVRFLKSLRIAVGDEI